MTLEVNRADRTRPGDSGGMSAVSSRHLLTMGSSGPEVKELQEKLKAAGFDCGSSGRFDASTLDAVYRYQEAKGLKVDGQVGQQTWGSFFGLKLPPGVNLLAGGGGSGALGMLGQDGAILGPGQQVNAYIHGRPQQISVVSVGNGQYMRADAARGFLAMQAAARKAGINLSATSGFRTMQQQQRLYQMYLNGTGNLAAKPGYSNHQGGIAMDIGGIGGYGTRAYAWLKANAASYGFRNDVGGEPWHWTFRG